jgi:hypothetical protein
MATLKPQWIGVSMLYLQFWAVGDPVIMRGGVVIPLTDCYLLWKESLNNDGHQFHQYEQNKQSSLIFTEYKKDHDIGNPGPGWVQAQKYNGVKSVNGITTPP